MPRTTSLLGLLIVLAGAVLWIGVRTEDGGAATAEVATPEPVTEAPATPGRPPGELARPGEPEEPEKPAAPSRPARLSPFQLDVDLDLVWAAPSGSDEARAWGSGRTARLEGQFADARGNGFRAEVTIVAGANEGRSAVSGDDGTFAMADLYPGLAIVEVKGPAIPGSRREVLLGRERTSLLNIGYGRLASVTGVVADFAGGGVEGARVVFDGQETTTDAEGTFHLSGVAGGAVLVEVSKPGYASHREKINIASGTTITADRLRYVLQEESTLVLSAKRRPGVEAPVDVYLMPSRATLEDAFPWYEVNPIRLQPGGEARVGGLPAVPVHVRAFQRGMTAPSRLVTLSRGRESSVAFEFEPAPTVEGRVTLDGRPVSGARVRLEAPDRMRATLAHFRMPSSVLSAEVLSPLPPAFQEATTDASGEFTFTTWPEDTSHYYLEARGPAQGRGEELWAGRLVAAPSGGVELQLERLDHGDARLVLRADRDVSLRVASRVSGRSAEEPAVFAPDEEIAVEGLRAGTWRLVVSWQGGTILERPKVVVEEGEETALDLELPERFSTL